MGSGEGARQHWPKEDTVHPRPGSSKDGVSVTPGSESSPSTRWGICRLGLLERRLRVLLAIHKDDFLFFPC